MSHPVPCMTSDATFLRTSQRVLLTSWLPQLDQTSEIKWGHAQAQKVEVKAKDGEIEVLITTDRKHNGSQFSHRKRWVNSAHQSSSCVPFPCLAAQSKKRMPKVT